MSAPTPHNRMADAKSERNQSQYYAAVTAVDIIDVVNELMPERVRRSHGRQLEIDCPRHSSQSGTSFHVDGASQRWKCWGCGTGGGVLHLVQFFQSGAVTKGIRGEQPATHRQARDWLAARAGLPPLEKWGRSDLERELAESRQSAEDHIFGLLTLAAEFYATQLQTSPEVLAWTKRQWGFDPETLARFTIGYAENRPATHASLRDVAISAGYDSDDLIAAGLCHARGGGYFFERRLIFPFFTRGFVTTLIGRKTEWTEPSKFEAAKYRKLRVHNPDDERGALISPCITQAGIWGDDCLLARPSEVVIAEGIADAVALAARGIPVISPVTVRFRGGELAAVGDRLARYDVSRVVLALDNEISRVGVRAALAMARVLSKRVRRVGVLNLPPGPDQIGARTGLLERFKIHAVTTTDKELRELQATLSEDDASTVRTLIERAKIDIAEWFKTAGDSAAGDFRELASNAPSVLEYLVSEIPKNLTGDALDELLDPILADVARLGAAAQDRALELIRSNLPNAPKLATLRKMVGEARRARGGNTATNTPPAPGSVLPFPAGGTTSSGASSERRNLTDTGNAERLVARHGRDLHFCHPWQKWLIWDGTRFAIDDRGEITLRSVETVRSIYDEASSAADKEDRFNIAKWAKSSESKARIDAMNALARVQPGVPQVPDELDSDPFALNVLNGTLDLTNGTLRPHSRSDLITKICPVEFDADAECPTWLAFLDRIMAGNARLIRFLQRAIGYSLTATTGERVLFILYGTGANGKSTLLETLGALLGDYATTTPTDTLMVKRDSSSASNDLAPLKGLRLVAAAEAEDGRRLAEARIKQLTGNDQITARFLYGEFFSFRPKFKIWLSTNHKPIIRGTDEGIWDRIKLIPFDVRIPLEERDGSLLNSLQAELSGILTWAIMGCLEWQKYGLGTPDEILEAGTAYRHEMDVLGAFIADCCEVDTPLSATAADLYSAYTKWCEDSGEFKLSQRSFGMRLAERGQIEVVRSSGGRRVWRGIGLQIVR